MHIELAKDSSRFHPSDKIRYTDMITSVLYKCNTIYVAINNIVRVLTDTRISLSMYSILLILSNVRFILFCMTYIS